MLAEGLLRLMAEWLTTPKSATVLVIEDLHCSAPRALKALEYLADNLAGQTGTWSWRPSERARPERARTPSALSRLVERLSRSRWVPSTGRSPRKCFGECLAVEIVPADLLEMVPGAPKRWHPVPHRGTPSAPALADPSGGAVPALDRHRVAGPPRLIAHMARLSSSATWRCWAASSTGTWLPLPCDARPTTPSLRSARRSASSSSTRPEESARFCHALTVEAVQQSLLPERAGN